MSAAPQSDFHRLAAEKRRSRLEELPEPEQQEEEAPKERPHLTIPVRRVMPQDVQELGPWLLPRLKKIWPTVSEPMWASKIRAWMMMNDASFVRTDHAVGLAMAVRGDMDSRIRVEERFVLSTEQSTRLPDRKLHPIDAELLSIYRTMIDWARSKDAYRFNVLNCSDLMDGVFVQYLGWSLQKTTQHSLKTMK